MHFTFSHARLNVEFQVFGGYPENLQQYGGEGCEPVFRIIKWSFLAYLKSSSK